MPRKKTKKEAKIGSFVKLENEIANSKDPEFLLGDRRKPRDWNKLTNEQKLDYIASRIIAEDRHGVTSHKELKETGILSISQYERRRKREVYSQTGDLDTVKVKPGQFSKSHVRDLRGVRDADGAAEKNGKVIKKSLKTIASKKKTTTKKKVKKNGGK